MLDKRSTRSKYRVYAQLWSRKAATIYLPVLPTILSHVCSCCLLGCCPSNPTHHVKPHPNSQVPQDLMCKCKPVESKSRSLLTSTLNYITVLKFSGLLHAPTLLCHALIRKPRF